MQHCRTVEYRFYIFLCSLVLLAALHHALHDKSGGEQSLIHLHPQNHLHHVQPRTSAAYITEKTNGVMATFKHHAVELTPEVMWRREPFHLRGTLSVPKDA